MAASKSGTSVIGIQQLLFDSASNSYAALAIVEGSIGEASLAGFISLEYDNGIRWYQIAGASLWYQGLVFVLPSAYSQNVLILANWKKAGLTWVADLY